ncbi:hypothetical protein M5K25_013817 [Dendrobium thyrsiflorum]|uniref:Uncharacterized protein n=1 Tax=Dendrobium thyrsiflorum TaxID=117978 RepID=A0ABD0V189_DENTH
MGSKRKSSDENGDGEASPTRAGGSKRCCCDRRDRGYTLDEFMKKLNPRDLEQNFCELTGSSSSQTSNVLVQPNGMFTIAQGLAAPIGLESGNSSKTIFMNREGILSGTIRLDLPVEDLLEENERSYLPNNFDIGSPLRRDKWLMLLFVARFKMAARRPRESKCSETNSPRRNWLKLVFIVERIHQGCRNYPRLHVKVSLNDINLYGKGRENPPRMYDLSEVICHSLAQ